MTETRKVEEPTPPPPPSLHYCSAFLTTNKTNQSSCAIVPTGSAPPPPPSTKTYKEKLAQARVSPMVLNQLSPSLGRCFAPGCALGSSSLLGSLWRLFRGRKRNVLRRRVDSCAYDPSRLLLGTLVFTVLFFLTPTVAVFYTFFCIVHAVAVGIQVRKGEIQRYRG